ncbi:nuclear transport factor 2 family protein, partial [Rhodococcus erythropolis]
MSNLRRRAAWMTVPAAAALLLTACSNDAESATPSSSTTSTSVVAEQGDQLESNKTIVTDFYELAFNGRQVQQAADRYLGDVYIQHNPTAADGAAGFVSGIGGYVAATPGLHVEITRVFAEGDLVALQSHTTSAPGDRGQAVFDIFRVDNGKIVEHWDAIQDVPETSANPNTMFDGPTSSPSRTSEVLERNTANALTFLQLAFNEGKAAEAADQLIGPTYTQHNPSFADGRDAFVTALAGIEPATGDKATTFPRTVAEGDFVFV